MSVSENKAQDLLSAALDESGLGLELGGFTGLQNAPIGFAKPDIKFNVRIVPHLNHVGSSVGVVGGFSDQAALKPGSNIVRHVGNSQPFPFGGFGENLTARHTLPTLVELNKLSVMSKMSQVALGSSTSIQSALARAGPKPQSNGTNSHTVATSQVPLTGKELIKLWSNVEGTSKMKQSVEKAKVPVDSGDVEEDDEEDNELGQAETYADYMPTKLRIGEKHPDPVVETSSLSSVPPPDVWYRLSIPEEVIDYNYLSALQLEAIVYASQQHEQLLPDGSRAAFLVGDGAGVGKGRTIAGIIYENYILGRKRAIWVSVSNDLKYDAQRDLKDIGAGKLDVHSLNKFKYAKISSKVNGSVKKGVVFATYSSLIGESQSGGKYKTRLKQLLHWCGEKFDGVIVFDECHKAKNLCPVGSSKPTKTGLTVLELQNRLPKARVVYASATGASEPRNMAYMTRLGLWGAGTPFPEFNDFIQSVEKRGVGAMEIVAMDMKLRGMYIARQLSFSGVTFKIEEIPLSKDFIRVYDDSVRLWVSAREKFQRAAELIDAEQRMRKTMWGQFWSAHQRFFKYLCIASKVKHAVKLAREAVKIGKCVVIGLQSTGEARTLEQLEEAGGELNDFVSTAKGVFQTLVERHFPAPDRRRVHKLLGIEGLLELSWSPSATTSRGKRKMDRNSMAGAKRLKEDTFSSDDSLARDVAKGKDKDSDFVVSESDEDSDPSSALDSDSDVDSDFNPFGEGSDSEDDPWLNRNKKSKGVGGKAGKKKRKKKSKAKKKKKKSKGSPATMARLGKTGPVAVPLPANGNGTATEPPQDAIERACVMKEELLDWLEQIGDKLPPNTLDQLIDDLGGPENVAEMTGRKGRIVSNDDGTIQYESRCELDTPLETMNLTEKQRFMDGEKHIAIISEAASSGISLQSDRRARNQRRRVHLTLELPWSADRAIQQFGRTHRSNQVNAPEYLFLISDLAGERRFASIVAKRLESLGALTHGDRRATETRDLSRFNIDNRYGRTALDAVMKAVMGLESPLIAPPDDYDGDFFADVKKALVGVGLVVQDERFANNQTLDKDYNNMSKFLNRILGMEVELQNRLFKYFTDTLNSIVSQAKKAGRFDLGIMDLGSDGDRVKRIKCDVFIMKHVTGVAKIELHTVSIERGMTWNQALDIWSELVGSDEGFYVTNPSGNKCSAILAVGSATAGRKKDKREKTDKMYSVYRPNTGLQKKTEPLADIKKKYRKVVPDEAQPFWQDQYDKATVSCTHAYWRGSCKRVTLGLPCDIGLRRKSYHILSGSVLNVWTKVEAVLTSVPGAFQAKMQVIRLKTEGGLRIVGTVIPLNCYAPLIKVLAQDATKNYTEAF